MHLETISQKVVSSPTSYRLLEFPIHANLLNYTVSCQDPLFLQFSHFIKSREHLIYLNQDLEILKNKDFDFNKNHPIEITILEKKTVKQTQKIEMTPLMYCLMMIHTTSQESLQLVFDLGLMHNQKLGIYEKSNTFMPSQGPLESYYPLETCLTFYSIYMFRPFIYLLKIMKQRYESNTQKQNVDVLKLPLTRLQEGLSNSFIRKLLSLSSLKLIDLTLDSVLRYSPFMTGKAQGLEEKQIAFIKSCISSKTLELLSDTSLFDKLHSLKIGDNRQLVSSKIFQKHKKTKSPRSTIDLGHLEQKQHIADTKATQLLDAIKNETPSKKDDSPKKRPTNKEKKIEYQQHQKAALNIQKTFRGYLIRKFSKRITTYKSLGFSTAPKQITYGDYHKITLHRCLHPNINRHIPLSFLT